jgi:hypothetical protein
MNVLTLLLSAMLFQAPPPVAGAKPLIDNERVVVWDLEGGAASMRPGDAVLISFTGKAAYIAKGTMAMYGDRNILIDLKDHAPKPLENKSGYPLAFPRPGSLKIFENDRVIVWDYTWATGVPTPMHFHDKEVVVTYLENGDLESTTPDGQKTVNPYKRGDVRFNLANRSHTEKLINGRQHAIITELK